MFPPFRRDGQQPSNQGSASESVPRVDNSPENSPPGADELEQPVVAEEGQQGAAESPDGLEQGAAEQPDSKETTTASSASESAVGPEGVAQGPSSEPYEAPRIRILRAIVPLPSSRQSAL